MKFNKSRILKIVTFVLILIIGFIGMNFLSSSNKQTNRRDVVQEIRKVETQYLTYADVPVIIEGNGTIESQKTINIVSEVQGIVTYAKNDLKSGTYIKKG